VNKPGQFVISGFCRGVYEVFDYLGTTRIPKERRCQTGTR